MVKRKAKASEAAAVDDLLRRKRAAISKGDYKEVANLSNQLGNQHRLLGNYDEALEYHEEEVTICKAHLKKDKLGLAIGYRNIGEVLTEMKEEEKALKNIRFYLKIAKELGNIVEEQRAYITLGRAYLSLADKETSSADRVTDADSIAAIDRAESSFRTAYNLLNEDQLKDQLNDEKELMMMKCNNCQNLGLTLELKGKLVDATAWITKAIDIGSKYQFHENLAPCYTLICGLYLKAEKYKNALKSAKDATKAAKALGNHCFEIESQLLEAKALFAMDEVDTGKKILKRLRLKAKKKDTFHGYLEELDPLLMAAVKVSRKQDVIFVTDKRESSKLAKLHEVMGDNYTTLMNYHTAILHYKKSCEILESSGENQRRLAKLYFSIAESYKDLQDYTNAYNYYSKEMSINQGNPVEEFKTQTNITVVLEKLNKPTEEVVDAHEFAIALAKLTKNLSRQVTALNNFGIYLKSIGRLDESQKNLDLANQINEDNNLEDSEELESDSQDLLDEESDIDLDNLSDEEESDDEADDDKKDLRKRFNKPVNEAGEYHLHLAAKKGDLKSVRRLIRQGHPVRVRDNAGWTPLHEACNFGHASVVEELLKHGAEVNDAGGALAERITPLHDAAGNCHCEVIQVLLQYGANVLAKDIEGRRPIESLVCWRYGENGINCSEQEEMSYREVKKLLMEYMAKAGKPYRKSDDERARKKHNAKSRSPKTSLLASKPQDLDCPIPVKITTDDFDPDQEGQGRKLYEKTMKRVRHKDVDACSSSKEKPRPISPGPQGALIPSELDVHENWLLPDNVIKPSSDSSEPLIPKTSKPKRKRDPVDDSFGENRSSRRRTGGNRLNTCREKGPRMSLSHELDNNDNPHNSPVLNTNKDRDFELMDLESGEDSSSIHSIENNANKSPVSTLLNDPFDDEEDLFSSLVEEDFVEERPRGNDNFLPSQRPMGSAVEFGRIVDVDVVDASEDDDNRSESPVRFSSSRSRANPKPVNRKHLEVSSSDDDDFQTSRNSRVRLSDLTSALKNSSGQAGTRKFRETRTVQSKLPYEVVRKSRKSDPVSRGRSSSIEEIPNRLPRVSSATSLHGYENRAKKAEVLRLKIRIEDKVLLVPVDENHHNESIDWLSKECAARYARSYGVKPILTLENKDGAILSGTDPISLVLEADERELVGKVIDFDLPPLVERYCSNCSDAAFEPEPEVKSCLNACQSSNTLHLTDVNLRGKAGALVLSALQRQSSLRVLALSGCSLFDSGLVELCKILPSLRGLIDLDISSNGITKFGFFALANIFLRTDTQNTSSMSAFCSLPAGLSTLILSHNPLGNSIGSHLSALINRLTSLKRLEVSNCDFNEKLFLYSKNELTKAFSNSRLEELDISLNKWKEGTEICLQYLPVRRIRVLNCSSCCPVVCEDAMVKPISALLSRNEDCCNLTTLQLNDCSLNDKTVDLLVDNFDRLVRLDTLELQHNKNLTALSLMNILERTAELNIPLTKLDLGCIPCLWDCREVTHEMIFNAIERKMSSNVKLNYLRLPSNALSCTMLTDEGHKLSKLETMIVTLMEDYAGNTSFSYDKHDTSITYRFDE